MFEDIRLPVWFKESYLNEIVAVGIGLKKVARQFVPAEYISIYSNILKKNGFEFVLLTDKNYFYVSRTKEFAKKACQYEINIIMFYNNQCDFDVFCKYVRKLGVLLGFPDCCVEFYLSCWLEQGITLTEKEGKIYSSEPNYAYWSYKNTKKIYKIDFRMNNFHFHSLLSFFPCSYDCKSALDYATVLFKNLSAEQRTVVYEGLRGTFLVLDESNMVIFKDSGDIKRNVVDYNPKKVMFRGMDKLLMDSIKNGNKLELGKNKICVFKDDEVIYEYEQYSGPFLLSFC